MRMKLFATFFVFAFIFAVSCTVGDPTSPGDDTTTVVHDDSLAQPIPQQPDNNNNTQPSIADSLQRLIDSLMLYGADSAYLDSLRAIQDSIAETELEWSSRVDTNWTDAGLFRTKDYYAIGGPYQRLNYKEKQILEWKDATGKVVGADTFWWYNDFATIVTRDSIEIKYGEKIRHSRYHLRQSYPGYLTDTVYILTNVDSSDYEYLYVSSHTSPSFGSFVDSEGETQNMISVRASDGINSAFYSNIIQKIPLSLTTNSDTISENWTNGFSFNHDVLGITTGAFFNQHSFMIDTIHSYRAFRDPTNVSVNTSIPGVNEDAAWDTVWAKVWSDTGYLALNYNYQRDTLKVKGRFYQVLVSKDNNGIWGRWWGSLTQQYEDDDPVKFITMIDIGRDGRTGFMTRNRDGWVTRMRIRLDDSYIYDYYDNKIYYRYSLVENSLLFLVEEDMYGKDSMDEFEDNWFDRRYEDVFDRLYNN